MSNPFDPNAPGAPPPPSSGWGAPPPPAQPPYAPGPTTQGAWNAPQGPYTPPSNSGGSGSKWVIGCLVVLGVCVACCGGSLFFGFRFVRNIGAQVVQQQATAMGTGNYAEVCSHNSPTLNATTPCAQYVTWLNSYAPWFTGATITADDVSFKSDPNRGARITVRVSGTGPRGSGHLTFAIVTIGNQFYVDAIVPEQP